MRGHDEQTTHMFSYLSPEQRVPADHPLRAVRALTDEALQTMSRRFASLYATTGRPSIPPEQLLRALLLQVLYTVRSERLLMEELNYNLLFRWFVGLNMDDPVWHPTTFTKNRDRLLSGDVAAAFFDAVQAHARAAELLSDEHFTVDGTQLEAWASLKSFRCVDAAESDPPEDPGNPTVYATPHLAGSAVMCGEKAVLQKRQGSKASPWVFRSHMAALPASWTRLEVMN